MLVLVISARCDYPAQRISHTIFLILAYFMHWNVTSDTEREVPWSLINFVYWIWYTRLVTLIPKLYPFNQPQVYNRCLSNYRVVNIAFSCPYSSDAGFDKEKAAEQSEKVEPPSNVSSPSKPESSSEMSTSTTDELEQTFAELRKWADTSSSKYLLLTVKREKRVGRLGSALKVSNFSTFEWMICFS